VTTSLSGPILVSGYRGAIGARLLRHLTDGGADARAASSSPHQGQTLLDLHDTATFPSALRGVEQVFLYANAQTAADFASAAAEAGVKHIVLLSSNAVTTVAAPDVNPMAAPFLAAENALNAGPVPVTVLRPGSFASNARQWIHSIRAQRAVRLPYPDARVDAVGEGDVAEVACRALLDPGLRGSTLDLTGPDAVSLAGQIRALAAALGEDIAVNRVTREEWKQSVGGYVTDDYADALLDYWKSLERHPASLTTTILDITGHPATGFGQWVTDNVHLFR
jgi:uncharacterized protein YbjT (DUF2867 family)